MPARTFSLEDQYRFAALSGDYNPLHLDITVARRSMLGGIAVHGMHVLLWALDNLAAQGSFSCFEKLRVNFDRGVLVDEKVHCSWNLEGTRWIGRIKGATGTLVRLSLVSTKAPSTPWGGRTKVPKLDCAERDIGDLSQISGKLDLALPESWREMFPHLFPVFPPLIVAVLLASTRLVGMECPGLHSIYSALQLNYTPKIDPFQPDDLFLHYKVRHADSRVQILDMGIEAGPVSGVVNTLVRPKPHMQPRLVEILHAVSPHRFARQNALVIGGSRGLGELACKLLVAGGACVTLTWRHGEQDALAQSREAEALGLSIKTLKFDIAAPPETVVGLEPQYTHLYYFATPHIEHGSPGQFNAAVFSRFLEYYVSGFARAVDWFRCRATKDACVWYPSTIYLTEMNPNFSEYNAAKACGETLCQQLAGQLAPLTFVTPRLPRLPTDQTQTLTATVMADGVATLLNAFPQ